MQALAGRVAAAAVLAIILGIGLWWLSTRSRPPAGAGVEATTSAPVSATATAASVITAAEVDVLVAALSADDPDTVRTAFAVPAAQTLDPALLDGLSRLRPVTIDEASLRPYGNGTLEGTAATGPTGRRSTWHIFLTRLDGSWKIAATEAR